MSVAEMFLAEVKDEAEKSRAVLARVPFEKADWVPHPKSMALLRLAGHVAELVGWVHIIITTDELDFATYTYVPPSPKNTADLLALLDKNVALAVTALETCSDDAMKQGWALRAGERRYYARPKDVTIRDMALSHLIHHRAQLGVYLRLLDVPVPPTFGPTADEDMEA